MGPELLINRLPNVSRETLSRLQVYHDLLIKWQKAINLVSPTTLDTAWQRHFLDSGQIYQHIHDKNAPLADLGSGAGFPGLVLAIMGCAHVTLIESDTRKCAFLREVARETGVSVTIRNQRIEQATDAKYAVFTARALASIDDLLEMVGPLRAPNAQCLFLKPQNMAEGLTAHTKYSNITAETYPSLTAADGALLRLTFHD